MVVAGASVAECRMDSVRFLAVFIGFAWMFYKGESPYFKQMITSNAASSFMFMINLTLNFESNDNLFAASGK